MNPVRCIAFDGPSCIASGNLHEVALQLRTDRPRGGWQSVLVFDDLTAEVIELDLRGTPKEVLARLEEHPLILARRKGADQPADETAPKSAGRPKLGVIAREVTLLPRHWEWLAKQPGGASVALRKLVEGARHANAAKDQRRDAQEAAYRFMSAMAGNERGFEAATRALYAADASDFQTHTRSWPSGVRKHARRLAERAFSIEV